MGSDGFSVMTLPIIPNLFFTTQLFVKRHIAVKNDEKDYPPGRTLFITFPGEFLDKNSIKNILSQFVTVESIDLMLKHQKKGFINKAYLIDYIDAKIAYKNNYENAGKISKKVDEYMAKYDIMKEIERKAAKKALIDEEGFVKVVTGAKIRKSSFSMKKFDDFYKFQKKQTSQNIKE